MRSSPLDKNMPLAAPVAGKPFTKFAIYGVFFLPMSPPGAFFAPAEQAMSD